VQTPYPRHCEPTNEPGGVAISLDSNAVDRAGVSLCDLEITTQLGYIFREQPTSDYGVDAHVEIKRDGHPTGRLLGLQLKSGRSQFGEETAEGWKFRPEKRHIPYWLGHSLPMYVLLVDVEDRSIYWQELSERTLKRGPRGGIYVLVPRAQNLGTARIPWERAAEQFVETAGLQYTDNLDHLPPRIAATVEEVAAEDPQAAALVAAHLAAGRGTPELVVRTLTDSSPSWLMAGEPGKGLAVVADYAYAHGLTDLAVEVLLKCADLSAEKRYRYVRNAGLILVETDRTRARALLDSASGMPEAADDLRLAIGYAVLDHPASSAHPIALPPGIESKLAEREDDDLILSFLARRAEYRGDLDAAVGLAEKALALAENSSALMDFAAKVITRRAHSAFAQPGDQARGIRLATAAVDQLHKWSGPTQESLDNLLRSLTTAGRFREALDRALPAPDGKALPEEAIRPSVQAVAALAAMALGRSDLSARILDEMMPGIDRDIVRLETARPTESEEASWLALLDRVDESHPEALLHAVLRLSDLGVDRSSRLDVMVERGMIAPTIRDVAAVGASAAVNLDASLPALRLLAEKSELAAARLVALLSRAKRIDDAQVAAEAAHARFRNTEFVIQRAQMLRELGRGPEATIVATEALSDSALDPSNRRAANALLARLALDDAVNADDSVKLRLWRRAERHLLECVGSDDSLKADDSDVWLLADIQLQLGSSDEAFETLSRYDPPIDSAGQARLWLAVLLRQQTLPSHFYPRMLALADQFSDDPQLSGALLTTVIGRTRDEQEEPATPADSRQTLPGDLRAAAFDALNKHVERHGDQSPFTVLQAPTTQELIVQMTDLMRRDTEPLVELVEMVRQARVPLGLLATASQRPYASTIAQRPLGYYLATAAVEEEASLDEEASRKAPGRDVVVDASALLVASELGEYDRLRGNYRRVIMPSASHDDIARARRDLDGRSASSAFVTYDAASDSVVASEVDIDDHLAGLDRLSTIENAVTSVQIVPTPDMTPLQEIALIGSEPWLAPIALAKEQGVPLWSDDVAQRRLARHLGVESFGTTSAQQARADDRLAVDGISDEELIQAFSDRRDEVLGHLTHRVVDAPVDAQTVIDRATEESWNEELALVTVGRPGWWHMAPNPWADLQTILNAAASARVAVDQWRYHAMWGAARLTSDEPSRTATLLAAVALLPADDEPEEARVRHFRVADEIAAHRNSHTPTDFLADAATTLAQAGVLDDPLGAVEAVRGALQNQAGDR
jgi:tetratricopeptide (TPR) repeat protein